jgi:hypothetical protein
VTASSASSRATGTTPPQASRIAIAAARSAGFTDGADHTPAMPAPTSDGVSGIARTMRLVAAEPARDVARARARRDRQHDRHRRDVRRERGARLAHLLRLDREHDDRGAVDGARRRARVRARAGIDASSFARCASTGSTNAISRAERPRAIKPPAIALAMLPPPMNVIIRSPSPARRTAPFPAAPRSRPSAIAASRSAVIPIDSSSTSSPAARAASRQRASVANCARCTATSSGRLGDAHEAAQPKPRQRRDLARQRHRVAGRSAAFRRLAADVDLHEHLERLAVGRPRGGQPLGDLQAVDRLDRVEHGRRLRRLVALQRPDQPPFDAGQVAERRLLGRRLLHVVLAERPLAQAPGVKDALGRLGLGHGQQPDRCRSPARPPAPPGRSGRARLATPSRRGP